MAHVVCPRCGEHVKVRAASADPSYGATGQVAPTQAQLMAYAQDLASSYARQKRMAQYLPGDLRDRINWGEDRVAAERRYVTVLFADLVGFTRLASRLDAEEVFCLMNACFERIVAHVLKYDGVIDKFMGDAVMALFGAPVAHEDDPERAVRAALDMRAEMEVFSKEMESRLGLLLQLHIGIHSGEVIAGSVGVDEQLSYTVTGETVNLASRLQGLAEPGSIYVSEAVHGQTQHVFEYKYLGDHLVKGFETPVPVFAVQDERDLQVSAQPTSDITLPWIGRDEELERLALLWRRLAEGEGGVVTVLGEAGLGKTRLVRQWLASLPPDQATVWWGTAHMFQQRISYALGRDLLRQGLHLRPGEVSAAAVAVRQALLAQVGELAPFILALVHNQISETESHLRPEKARSQTFQAVRDLLVAQAALGPLIVVVDNWQWADDVSRDLLLTCLNLTVRHPILFCVLARSGVGSAGNPIQDIEATVGHDCEQIKLSPLWLSDSCELLSTLLVTETLTDEAQAVIFTQAQQAQGNPLYLKELLRLLVVEGVVEPGAASYERDDGRWQIVRPERLASFRVPPTLAGLAQANLDRLPIGLQEVLNYAAVIGPTFSLSLLQAVMAREREINTLPDQLQELVARGLIQPITADGHTFAFRSAVVQETIYNSMLLDRRGALHRLVADELEILPETETDASVELITYHFLRAGLPAKAVPYLIRAGRRAQNRSAHKIAIDHYLAALAVLDDAPRYEGERLGLLMSLGDAYCQLDQYDEAATHYKSGLEFSAQPEQRADLCRLLGSTYAAKGDWRQAWDWLERGLERLAEGQVPAMAVLRGQIYAKCAHVECRLGDQKRAELWAREAIVILEGTSDYDSRATCHETLSSIYSGLGREGLALQHATQASALRRNGAPQYTARTAYLLDWE